MHLRLDTVGGGDVSIVEWNLAVLSELPVLWNLSVTGSLSGVIFVSISECQRLTHSWAMPSFLYLFHFQFTHP